MAATNINKAPVILFMCKTPFVGIIIYYIFIIKA